MKKLLLAVLIGLSLVGDAQAITSTGNVTAVAGVVSVNANNTQLGAFQVSGTWVGTLAFEASVDGATFVALSVTPMPTAAAVTTSTANGVWTYVGSFARVRVRATAFTSGTAEVAIIAVQ